MKKLHLFILKSFLSPLAATFFISLFILVMQFLWKYVDDLVGKGLDWMVMAELLLYASLGVVPMALPLAILLASLMTFGNLGENYELTALKSAGISLQKIMAPLIILILFVAYGAFRFSNDVLPVANLKLSSLMRDIKMTKPELDIKERVFYNGVPDFNIKIQKKDKNSDMLRGVMIYDHRDRMAKNTNVTLADSGKLQVTNDKKYMKLTLYSGIRYDEKADVDVNNQRRRPLHKRDNQQFRTDVFDKQISYMELEGFGFSRTDESIFRSGYRMKNLTQLNHDIDSIDQIKNKLTNDLKTRVNNDYFSQLHANYRRENEPQKLDFSDTESLNIDSAYDSLSVEQKKMVLDRSLSQARRVKQTIEDQSRFILNEDKRSIKHSMEKHRKFTLAFACIVFFFIGAPLGAIIRKGGLGMPVVISVLFFIFYYIVNTFGEKLAREGVWVIFPGMWLSSFILFIIGVFLTYKSSNDSSLLNADAYYIFIEKVLKRFKKPSANKN